MPWPLYVKRIFFAHQVGLRIRIGTLMLSEDSRVLHIWKKKKGRECYSSWGIVEFVNSKEHPAFLMFKGNYSQGRWSYVILGRKEKWKVGPNLAQEMAKETWLAIVRATALVPSASICVQTLKQFNRCNLGGTGSQLW